MAGHGGVWVEVLNDVVFGYPHLSIEEARDMIDSLRCEPLIAGYRGKPGVDKAALAELIQRVGSMLLELPAIGELDLNPIVFDPAKGRFIVVDARIRKS
jgi:acyl-CoA synthetase (NDP forming)